MIAREEQGHRNSSESDMGQKATIEGKNVLGFRKGFRGDVKTGNNTRVYEIVVRTRVH